MNLVELAKTIRKVRLQQNMTVEQLAKKCGFSKGFISQVENFRQTPSIKALTRISDALGVSMSDLFNEQGPA
ncbi:MAG: helix-turn-helix transcriptional regulator, partial [Lentisphaeria bacterium]|nr:helix-turn-helix transcriptional regulator [Lentisphaeria bacterium]